MVVTAAREALTMSRQRRVFWAIVVVLSFALAIGFPIAGYFIVEQIRVILFQQVMHDNEIMAELFEHYLREAHLRNDSREAWLADVQEHTEGLLEPDRGYVCLIDSTATLRVAPMLMDAPKAVNLEQAVIYPVREEDARIDRERPMPISSLLAMDNRRIVRGVLNKAGRTKSVDFLRVEIDGERWLIGVHQYERAVQQNLESIYSNIVVIGSFLFAAILIPFALFTGRLIYRHERERSDYIGQIEDQVEQIAQVNAQLQSSNEELKRIQDEKGRLYARLSHDLRTPLNSVMSACSLVADEVYGAVNEAQRKALGTIERNVNVLLRLIDAILQLAKIESGQLQANPSLFSPGELLNELQSNLYPLADQRGIELRQSLRLDWDRIETDSEKLYLILQNLTANAIRFTNEGFVEVGAEQTGVDEVAFYVKDTGPGIPQEEQERIFDAFTQGSRQGGKGIGLGLTISKELATLLGGRLDLHSSPQEGTTFRILFPAGLIAPGDKPAVAPQTQSRV